MIVCSVAIITLSPNHPVLKNKLIIDSIDFSGGRNTDRLANKVSGKRKHGGQQLVEQSVICTLKCRGPNQESCPPSKPPSAVEPQLKEREHDLNQSSEQQSVNPVLDDKSSSVSNFNINPSRSDQDDKKKTDDDGVGDNGEDAKKEDAVLLSDNGSDKDGWIYYPIVAGMKGTLIEINEKLITNPGLIVTEVILIFLSLLILPILSL